MIMKGAAAAAAAMLLWQAAEPVQDWADSKEEWIDSNEFEETKAVCRALKGKAPPAADRPDAATAAALKGCDSEALYYGIGMPRDPVRARQCAFLEADAADAGGNAAPFTGRDMLMTIYANGDGAAQDLDVATHLACRTEAAPAESHGRVLHLQAMKLKAGAKQPFHLCDDVTSGLAMSWCADHEARISEARRAETLRGLAAGWSAADQAAFARLQAAMKAFAEARADGEVDMTGTMRGALWIAAREEVEDEFVDTMIRLGEGRAPEASAADHQAADKGLNAAYRAWIAELDGVEDGTLDREAARAAQRAWLGYRDAFVAFAAVKYPAVSRDSMAAWLTRQRTRMLLGEAEEAGR